MTARHSPFATTLPLSPFPGSLFGDPPPSPGYLYFESLGSGSSGNCSILYHAGEALILDAGIGIRTFKKRALTLLGSDVKPVGILVTHDHGDHVRGLLPLARFLSVPVFGSPEVCRALRSRTRHDRYGLPGVSLRVIEAEELFSVGSFRVKAFEVPHDAVRNFGYTVTVPSGAFSLITDVGKVTQRIRAAIRESNFLVLESNFDEGMLLRGSYTQALKARILGGEGHLSNALAGETVAEEMHPGLGFVALCHLSGNNNTPALALESFIQRLAESGITASLLTEETAEPDTSEDATILSVTALGRNVVSPLFRLG